MLLRHYTFHHYNQILCMNTHTIYMKFTYRWIQFVMELRKIYAIMLWVMHCQNYTHLALYTVIHPDVHIIYPCQIKFIFQNQYYILNKSMFIMLCEFTYML